MEVIMMADRSNWDQSFLDSDVTSHSSPPGVVADERLLSVSGKLRCQQRTICAAVPETTSGCNIQREVHQIVNNRTLSSSFYRNIVWNNSHHHHHHPEVTCLGVPTSFATRGVPSQAVKYPSVAICRRSSESPGFVELGASQVLASDKHTRSDTHISASNVEASIPPSSYSLVASSLPAWDVDRLELVYRRLAVSGFYVGGLSVDEAASRLARWPVGSFLLRNSSDKRYKFAVSVQTPRGTTSIRVAYRSGLFRLDCNVDQEHLMPTFDCALRLVRHYVGLSRREAARDERYDSLAEVPSAAGVSGHGYVLLEATGRRDTPVLLRTAYRQHPSCLSHICRVSVNRAIVIAGHQDGSGSGVVPATAIDRLYLSPSLKTYLKDYPYDI